MAFTICTKRLRVHYVILLVVLIVILLCFWNNTAVPAPVESELRLGTPENLSRKSNGKIKLFNHDFRYILSPDPCPSNITLAVIIVTSHYHNVETRSAMRRAFPQEDLSDRGVRRVFLLGQGQDNVFMKQASILHESKRFGDIIQGNFIEAYRNLTYKHVMGLKWASENCLAAKYVIKMDDDIVIYVNKALTLLKDMSLPTSFIAGYVFRDMQPIREPANKWYVTREEYRFPRYPSFVSGWFYITTPEVALKLVRLTRHFKYFWIDDVLITGILAKKLKIKRYNLKQYFTVYPEFLQCCIAGVKRHLDCDTLVGPNGGDDNLFYEFNEAVKTCESRVCRKRVKPLNETCVAERKVSLRGGNAFVESYKLH